MAASPQVLTLHQVHDLLARIEQDVAAGLLDPDQSLADCHRAYQTQQENAWAAFGLPAADAQRVAEHVAGRHAPPPTPACRTSFGLPAAADVLERINATLLEHEACSLMSPWEQTAAASPIYRPAPSAPTAECTAARYIDPRREHRSEVLAQPTVLTMTAELALLDDVLAAAFPGLSLLAARQAWVAEHDAVSRKAGRVTQVHA